MQEIDGRLPPPSWRSFLRSRFISPNGALAVLYLTLSLWIVRHPQRAVRLWQRMQGNAS